jgi:hypothetical protein
VIRSMRSLASWGRLSAAILFAAAMTGCASVYVDGAVKEVPSAQFIKPAKVAPVQLFFEFQTKGVANARATELLKTRVVDQVKASGLFDSVSDQSTATAGTLSLTLNNVPLSDDAFSKGFVTGLTFGLAGSQVSDGYLCTLKFTPASGQAPLVKSARHAIHTTMGAAPTPGNAVKAAGFEDAAFTMTRQVLSQLLDDLSKDPAFGR